MNRLIVPAAFVAGVAAMLIMAAAPAPEATSAPAPAAVQTLNGSEATPSVTPPETVSSGCPEDLLMAEDGSCVNPHFWDDAPTVNADPGSAAAIPLPPAAIDELGPDLTIPPCPQEDSDNCYWDAAQRGNHVGTSFIRINGHDYTEATK